MRTIEVEKYKLYYITESLMRHYESRSLNFKSGSEEVIPKVNSRDGNGYNVMFIEKDFKKCLWQFHWGHGGEWTTSCGTIFDANDFGCKAIYECPRCGRETEWHE